MIKQHLQNDIVQAMKAKDARRLKILRMALSAIKQFEIDQRADPSGPEVLTILERMIKQRNDASEQFHKANRQDLHDQEVYEIDVIQSYLPEPLSLAELSQLVTAAIEENQAMQAKDMGRVIASLKPKVQGKADMKLVSQLVMQQLKSNQNL